MSRFRLRDYQQRDVDRLRQCYRSGLRAPLYVLPTGGGKTVTFGNIAESAAARANKTLVLVHRQELLTQSSRTFTDIGIGHGLIAPGHSPTADLVQVASVQTLVRRMARMRWRPDLIVIDEAHHATAGTWARIVDYYSEAMILGVTATASRQDGQGLGAEAGGLFDALIEGPAAAELMDDGYLVRAAVYSPPVVADLDGIRRQGGDLARGETAKRMDKPTITGDAVKHYARICGGQPAIAFCASVAHAEHVAREFSAAGFPAASLDGTMSDVERRGRLADLAAGRICVLTSCDIVSEGFDLPRVAAAILLRPTDSLGLFLQQIGRVLRPVYAAGYDLETREGRLAAIAASDKPFAFILDHVGNVGQWQGGVFEVKHGMPDDDREWSLEGRQKGRSSNSGGARLPVMQCPQCFAAHKPAPVCPQCQHVYKTQARKIEQADGELQAVSPEAVEANRLRQEALREQARARTADALVAAGKSPGQAQHILAARLEKQRLQDGLRRVALQWSDAAGVGTVQGFGFGLSEIVKMKPKQLRETAAAVAAGLEQIDDGLATAEARQRDGAVEGEWEKWRAQG